MKRRRGNKQRTPPGTAFGRGEGKGGGRQDEGGRTKGRGRGGKMGGKRVGAEGGGEWRASVLGNPTINRKLLTTSVFLETLGEEGGGNIEKEKGK